MDNSNQSNKDEIQAIKAEATTVRANAEVLAQTVRDQALEIREIGKRISEVLKAVRKIDTGPGSVPADDYNTLVDEINEVQNIAQKLKNENQT